MVPLSGRGGVDGGLFYQHRRGRGLDTVGRGGDTAIPITRIRAGRAERPRVNTRSHLPVRRAKVDS